MKLLIEIPEYAYERTKEYYDKLETGTEVDAEVVYIAEGTPIEIASDKELEMVKLVRESDVIDRTDCSELAQAFNYLFDKYIETLVPSKARRRR